MHVVTCGAKVESVGRIFDEHRRQDILMIQERDDFQRSINQEEDDDCIECVWMYDSNLNRELLKCDFSSRWRSCFFPPHSALQPQHVGHNGGVSSETLHDATLKHR